MLKKAKKLDTFDYQTVYTYRTYFITKSTLMIQKFTHIFILTAGICLCLSTLTLGQMCEGKKRHNTGQSVEPPQRIAIKLPDNYKPPTANPKLIFFPETTANKKKQKQLLRKRKNRKKQGCIAANF